MKIAQNTRFVFNITPDEIETAKEVKRDFDGILENLDEALKTITQIRDAIIKQHPSQDELIKKYKGRMIRYKRKIIEKFNIVTKNIGISLEKMQKINDPEMLRLRDVLIAEVSEFCDGAQATMDLLEEPGKKDFTQTLEQLTAQMEKRYQAIQDVIDSQIFGHLDYDILGRMKISQMRFNIKKRSRLINLIIKEG